MLQSIFRGRPSLSGGSDRSSHREGGGSPNHVSSSSQQVTQGHNSSMVREEPARAGSTPSQDLRMQQQAVLLQRGVHFADAEAKVHGADMDAGELRVSVLAVSSAVKKRMVVSDRQLDALAGVGDLKIRYFRRYV